MTGVLTRRGENAKKHRNMYRKEGYGKMKGELESLSQGSAHLEPPGIGRSKGAFFLMTAPENL
jgi:hypothetical protein